MSNQNEKKGLFKFWRNLVLVTSIITLLAYFSQTENTIITNKVLVSELEYDKTTRMWIDEEGKPFSGVMYDTYPDSKIKLFETFIKNGKIEGDVTYFYKNGMMRQQIPMKNGGISGEPIYYNPEGEVIDEEEYRIMIKDREKMTW